MKLRINQILLQNRNLLIFLILGLGLLPLFIITGGLFLDGDITTQMLPFVYETKRLLSSGNPWWSWNTFLGDNFVGAYSYYTLFNPFTWINCLFPYKFIPLGFTICLFLKFLCCGWTCNLYLKKLGFDNNLTLIGSLLYVFSSWTITNLYYYMYVEPMIVFTILLWSIEKIIRNESYSYSILSIVSFLVVITNYYFAPGTFLLGTIYFFCRLLTEKKNCKSNLLTTAKAFISVFIGILLGSIVLFPVLEHLENSQRNQILSLKFSLNDFIERFLYLFIPKTHEGYYGYLFLDDHWNSNSANIALFGLLPSIILFFRKGLKWLKIFIGILLVLYLSPFNGVFLLFTHLCYTRWAYGLTLAFILGTLYYFKNYGFPSKRNTIIYIVLIASLYFPYAIVSSYWHFNNIYGNKTIAYSILLEAFVVFINLLGIYLLSKNDDHIFTLNKYIIWLMVVIVPQIIAFTFYCNANTIFFHKDKISYSTYLYQKDYLHNDASFRHRTDFVLTALTSNGGNLANLTNSPSVEAFHSALNSKFYPYFPITSKTDYFFSFIPSRNRASFNALMSVKELTTFVNEENNDSILLFSTPALTDGKLQLHEFAYYIPMGFTYDYYQLNDSVLNDFTEDNEIDITLSLLDAISINKDDETELSQYLTKKTKGINLSLDSIVNQRCQTVCSNFEGDTKGFSAEIELDTAKVVFFSVISDKGFTAKIDGTPTKIYDVNLGLSAIVVPSGSHKICFDYFPPGLTIGFTISLCSLILLALLFFFEYQKSKVRI